MGIVGPRVKRVWKRARYALAVAGLMAGLAGCTGADGERGIDISLPGKARAPGDVIRVSPEDGRRGVPAEGPVEVAVDSGRLERVTVVQVEDAQRTRVPGEISADGLRWRPRADARLALAAKYSVDAVALDAHGRRSARHTTFTTVVPESRFIGYFKPENRSTVGTGMIVSFGFNLPIENRDEVERAIRVTSDPPVEVVGHWFGKERLDFRPAAYWRPGTKVTVELALRDVEGAPGVYGIQRKKVGFTVGRSQVSLVDAAAHTMEVRRNGEVLATVPITAGAPKTTTYNGKMVVTELYDVTRMDGRTVGFGGEYDIKDVPHAMRLTESGTFLHGNYWASPDTFGSANVSHGCVGLRDEKGGSAESPAGWFFDRTLIGDVVEVVNSRDRKVAPDNGLGGWNMDWAQWKAGSALH
ncbi:Ig-like domain-containing protein [Streptomyces sp. NBC_00094]|uniref:L,D-transpeptidase n=1 Tax=Streptomyces sp. NBC_00094 TaxID=2903620 RepID=UPI00225AA8AB|nr:Ig-like domain-containing protein [Streptomyces sp. NBC_00094]MCX5393309.1 Ig-like domain-containing protein [Streptomyces sp. NBC_00094]